MDRGELSLVPEWYKGASGNLNPLNGSSHFADEINIGFSTKNRFSVSFCEHDGPRSLSFTERTSSSSHKTTCSNGSVGQEDLPFRAYSSFGRSYCDRNRDREEELEVCDRNRPLLEDNGFLNNPDSLATNKLGKESLWQSHSMLSGSGDSWLKRPAHDSSNNNTSEGSIVTGISKSSFEKNFPMLGEEEKHLGSEVAIVASPGLSNSIHDLRLAVSSSLNMAETLSQSPARVGTSPQLPNDSRKIEELHRLQILKLRPVMPSMTKNLGLHSTEKSKTKTARTAEIHASNAGQQSSSQLLIHSVPPPFRSDVCKISQPGNFQVLYRETTPSTIQPPKGSMNPKHKVDGKGGALSPRKFPSQIQNRNDFFNSLRKKSSSGQQHSYANNSLNSDTPSFILEKVNVQFAIDSTPAKNKNVFSCSVENGNCSTVDGDDFEEPEKLAPDEEEEAFLRSLGWEENAGVEALTHEEIESFLSVYKMRRPASKLNI